MIVRQVAQRPDSRAEPFIIIQKTKDSDQCRLGWKPVELGEASTRRMGQDRAGIRDRQKAQRVIEDPVEAVKMSSVRLIAAVVDDDADRLLALSLPQAAGNACREPGMARERRYKV
jgi:hypothetical protein